MTRDQFEHAIRAAGAVLGVSELLVIGSQADLIDGSIGEASMFHDTFGDYAQGVVETTAQLPSGWQDRLVRFETPATRGVTAWIGT